MDSVFTVIVGLVLVGVAAAVIARYVRTQRALREPVGGDACVACHSDIVETFAPECFRCAQCGFTWGDGMQAYAARQRQVAIAQLDDAGRRALALRELREASSCLLSAAVSLEHASKQLGFDLLAGGGVGTGDMYSRTRNEGIVKAAGEMGKAQRHVRHAAEATGYHIEGAGGSIDFHAEVFALDVHFESILVDIVGHMQVKKLQAQLADMRAAVDDALRRLEPC